MTNTMTDEQILELAKKRVKDKKDFYAHLTAWVIVNIFLIIVWAMTNWGGYPWFIWSLGPWGVGLLFHFLFVFVFEGKSDIGAIEKEVEKIKKEI
jgi:hypothetical protein